MTKGMFAACEGSEGAARAVAAGAAARSGAGESISGMPQTFHSTANVEKRKLSMKVALRGSALVESLHVAPA